MAVLPFTELLLVDTQKPNRPAIPDDELQILLALSFLADECAADGDADAGFRKLLHGLNRACAARRAGAEWGAELLNRYSEELIAFAARYCPRRVDGDLSPPSVH